VFWGARNLVGIAGERVAAISEMSYQELTGYMNYV
jgi:hypothetical protein